MKINLPRKTLLGWLLFLCMTVILCMPIYAKEGQRNKKVVRVGYLIHPGFQEGAGDQPKSGYGYEYLQKVACYAGWEYEYVNGNFSELLEMLGNGEIDLMGNLCYTTDRALKINFSSTKEGDEEYILYALNSRADLNPFDYSTFRNMKVGVNTDTVQCGYLEDWLSKNHLSSVQIVHIATTQEGQEALAKGKIDAIMNTAIPLVARDQYDWMELARVGSAPYYFAVSKGRPDLLRELNDALLDIRAQDYHYASRLYLKYYGYPTVNAADIKRLEEGNHLLKVGYLKNCAPFSYEDANGNLKGLISICLQSLYENYKVEVEPISFENAVDMGTALQEGKLDLLFPVLGDHWSAEEYSGILSDTVSTSTGVILHTGDYTDETDDVIAITLKDPFQYLLTVLKYPESQIKVYDNLESCVGAVVSGDASCTIMDSHQYFVNLERVPNLSKLTSTLTKIEIPICFGAQRDDPEIISILNSSLGFISDATYSTALTENDINSARLSLLELLRRHVALTIGVLIFIILLISGYFVEYVIANRRHRKELETKNLELEAAFQKAEAANHAKTDFLNRMSHDVRTPINGIVGMLDIMERPESSIAEIEECRGMIRTSVGYLNQILNDILDLGLLEQDKVRLKEAVFDVQEVIQHCRQLSEFDARQRGITIIWENEVSLKYPYLIGCSAFLVRCIYNVVSNAVRFNRLNGTTTVIFSVEEENVQKEGVDGSENPCIRLGIAVEDTGYGISEEFLPRIFEPFSQEKIDHSRTTYPGSGMGMSIVKNLVDLMGGEITIESVVNEGTTVKMTFPLQIAPAPEVGKKEVFVSLQGRHVLIVEDNKVNLIIERKLMESLGATVVTAENGAEGVRCVAESLEGSIDFILMDIMMPVMNGVEATRQIRAMNRSDTKTMPIIAVTANAFAEAARACLDAGMNDYIAKPIDRERLFAVLKRQITEK